MRGIGHASHIGGSSSGLSNAALQEKNGTFKISKYQNVQIIYGLYIIQRFHGNLPPELSILEW